MITAPKEYYQYLAKIQYYKDTYLEDSQIVPRSEKIFEINLDTRTIEIPNLVHVASDHRAEILYFKMPRFYDSMDLARTTGVIQYVNANNESRLYMIPFYDTVTYCESDEDGKIGNPMIIFPWAIEDGVTAKHGKVQFSMLFYIMDTDGENMVYALNTLPAELMVEDSLDTTYKVSNDMINIADEEFYDYLREQFGVDRDNYPANLVEKMAWYAKQASEKKITWMVID